MKETKTYKKLLNNVTTNKPTQIFVHHGGGSDANPMADTSEHTANGIELWHLGKGWDGIGYHYVIHKDGEVWKGRPEHVHGAHAKGYNQKSIGICLTGNFDATLPTKEQEESLIVLLRDMVDKYNIPTDAIKPHRSVANKTCYGTRLGDDWAMNLLDRHAPIEKDTSSNDLELEIKQLQDNQKLIVNIVTQILNTLK